MRIEILIQKIESGKFSAVIDYDGEQEMNRRIDDA